VRGKLTPPNPDRLLVLHRLLGQRLPVHHLRRKVGSLREVDSGTWSAPSCPGSGGRAPASRSRRT